MLSIWIRRYSTIKLLSSLLCAAVREEISSLKTRFAFGASLDLDLLGIEVGEETLIPGLAVSSSRALPLAGNISTKSKLPILVGPIL